VKRKALWLELAAAVLLCPLVVWGGSGGALLYFALLVSVVGRGALAELAGPLQRLRPKS
jgi:hypothetical protein